MSDRAINDYVRQKMRELRTRKKIGIRQLSSSTGIPVSSYCCMEGGYYNISLDNLFRILGVLGADIADVWPSDVVGTGVDNPVQLRKIQEFRINEIINLSEAEGAALFSLNERRCKVLLSQNLSDFLLDRICLYLENGQQYNQGLWFKKRLGNTCFVFFLKGKSCPEHIQKLIQQYLVIWSNLFSQVLQ
ncbi:MAG TPA: hypothetical protein PLP42_04795 [Acidobacteriota bacterium]|nr:hypothetical protein [Acidobacteriota bacterium]